eukprot:scaffold82217_cov25-Tisochrysis_lutea.AAC.1
MLSRQQRICCWSTRTHCVVGKIRLHRYIHLQGQLSGNTKARNQTWPKNAQLINFSSKKEIIKHCVVDTLCAVWWSHSATEHKGTKKEDELQFRHEPHSKSYSNAETVTRATPMSHAFTSRLHHMPAPHAVMRGHQVRGKAYAHLNVRAWAGSMYRAAKGYVQRAY